LIQICTTTDAWCPSARRFNLGRKCLEAVLNEPDWTVRVLTKNHEVENDFDLIRQYKDRVLVGLSITATSDKSQIMQSVEINASPIKERMRVMREARKLGLRTYAMLCPLLPGIADSQEQIDSYVQFAESIGAEEIFSEAVNPRGKSIILTQEALEKAGYFKEAQAVEAVRNQKNWSEYTFQLIRNLQCSVRKYSDISKLRFLLYPSGLLAEHTKQIKNDDEGVIWLQ
jgi:DNA repair photolyase